MKTIRISFRSKPISKTASNTLWALASSALFIFALIKESILPDRFFYDSQAIIQFIKSNAALSTGDSYSSTAAFFSGLGITENTVLLSLFSAILVFASFYRYFIKSKTKQFTFLQFAAFTFFLFLALTFMTMISKDLIVLLIITPFIYFAERGKKGLIVWSAIALVYAAFFRAYWVLFIAIFWGIYIVFHTTRKPLILLASILAGLLCLSFIFSAVLGADLDSFRMVINNYRIDINHEDARSIILPWVPGGGPIISWINTVITWATLIIPLPLFMLLTPYYIIISFFIAFLFIGFGKKATLELKNKTDPTVAACASLIIAFTVTQSIFEPDYGSYVRHLAPLYPMMFYVLLKKQLR